MARHLAQIIISGAQILGRAFAKTIQNEIQASQQAARLRQTSHANSDAAAMSLSGISLQEAKQILNVIDLQNVEKLAKNYKHFFKANDKLNGGSFYLQSKVFRAKERIDQELQTVQANSRKDPGNGE